MMKLFLPYLFLLSFNVHSLEVIKPSIKEKLILKIVRVVPDGFESYSMTNINGREMTLVCAQNRVYDNNPKALIEYRNFFNELAGKFTIERNEVCVDMARFIEAAHYGVDEEKPFIITLNTKKMQVEKIVYPNIDPLSDKGDMKDLLPKKDLREFKRPTMFFTK